MTLAVYLASSLETARRSRCRLCMYGRVFRPPVTSLVCLCVSVCVWIGCSVDSPDAVQNAMRLPEEFEEASGGDVEGAFSFA